MFNKIFGGGSSASSSPNNSNHKDNNVKEIEKFLHVHECEESPVGTSLGSKAGFTTLDKAGDVQKLYVTENLFAHAFTDLLHLNKCPDTIRAIRKLAAQGDQKSKKLAITAKTANDKNRVTILSQKTGEAVGVIQQSIHLTRQTYHIYGLEPMKSAKKGAHHPVPADKIHHQGKALFPYGYVEVKTGNVKDISLNIYNPEDRAYRPNVYTLERITESSGGGGGFFSISSKPYLVKRCGIPAAILRKGDFPDGITGPAWNITVAPGIDPIILVGLIGIMDTQNV